MYIYIHEKTWRKRISRYRAFPVLLKSRFISFSRLCVPVIINEYPDRISLYTYKRKIHNTKGVFFWFQMLQQPKHRHWSSDRHSRPKSNLLARLWCSTANQMSINRNLSRISDGWIHKIRRSIKPRMFIILILLLCLII